MPGATVNDGTGTTITFATSSFTAEITNIEWGGIERESIDTTNLSAAAPGANDFGNRTFIPSALADPGELTLEIHFNPDTLPPVHLVAETITVTFPLVSGDTTAAKWAGSGFATGYGAVVPLGDKMTTTMTVKMSGNQTRTAAT